MSRPKRSAERLIRLEQLDSLGVALLLAYLDGRAPQYVDEWFADRERQRAAAALETEPDSVRG